MSVFVWVCSGLANDRKNPVGGGGGGGGADVAADRLETLDKKNRTSIPSCWGYSSYSYSIIVPNKCSLSQLEKLLFT